MNTIGQGNVGGATRRTASRLPREDVVAKAPEITEEITPDAGELAQIIHDLKNPLASIALEVELITEQIAFSRAADHSRSLARISRNVIFLDRLINNLSDLCAVSHGRLALRRARCDLAKLLAAAIERVVPMSERHRVMLDIRVRVESTIDELRIERVVANLLDNAIKYTPRDAAIEVCLDSDGYNAQISVTDSGPGMSPAELAELFLPYRRGGSSRRSPGTGLGLYVSKQIVQAHRGSIGVDSARGRGSRFVFVLPLD